MALAITLIIIGAVLLAALELWLFGRLGKRDDRRRPERAEPTSTGHRRARPTRSLKGRRRGANVCREHRPQLV